MEIKTTTNKQKLDAYSQSYRLMQEAKRNDDVKAKLKAGDIIEISGFYFDWIVMEGYSAVLKKEGIYAVGQGGFIHDDLERSRILSVNGVKVV